MLDANGLAPARVSSLKREAGKAKQLRVCFGLLPCSFMYVFLFYSIILYYIVLYMFFAILFVRSFLPSFLLLSCHESLLPFGRMGAVVNGRVIAQAFSPLSKMDCHPQQPPKKTRERKKRKKEREREIHNSCTLACSMGRYTFGDCRRTLQCGLPCSFPDLGSRSLRMAGELVIVRSTRLLEYNTLHY